MTMRGALPYLYTACALSCQCCVCAWRRVASGAAVRSQLQRCAGATTARKSRAQHLQCAIHRDVAVLCSRARSLARRGLRARLALRMEAWPTRSRGVAHAPQFTYALCGSHANDLLRGGAALGFRSGHTC